ncbi:MAG: tRNA (guanosine(46)-N7)-methyltransferase TrmB [Clostridia bacterium]|nr:tRNA (guanosine(46)-N7)-methyltransferase TrmB [Clostridia bacterium]MDD4375769.1 tRNA (guanosine(46)-N7)-methyltransferase TrmB [Clostridia bacterium]
MRQRSVKNQDDILNNSSKYVKEPNIKKGTWKSKQYKEMHIEIGIGKGTFITTLAHQNPDILYVGIELSKAVLALAIKKTRRFEEEKNIKLNNLLIFDKDATTLDEIFNKEEVDKIYLNFSDPWHKNKHAKRRLTSPEFLKVYKNILKEKGKIEFKTDNRKLFEYSLLTLNESKVLMEYISLDLHKEDIPNIMTEYEEKFSKFGPIYKLIFSFRE